jgi:hypothetical protein
VRLRPPSWQSCEAVGLRRANLLVAGSASFGSISDVLTSATVGAMPVVTRRFELDLLSQRYTFNRRLSDRALELRMAEEQLHCGGCQTCDKSERPWCAASSAYCNPRAVTDHRVPFEFSVIKVNLPDANWRGVDKNLICLAICTFISFDLLNLFPLLGLERSRPVLGGRSALILSASLVKSPLCQFPP